MAAGADTATDASLRGFSQVAPLTTPTYNLEGVAPFPTWSAHALTKYSTIPHVSLSTAIASLRITIHVTAHAAFCSGNKKGAVTPVRLLRICLYCLSFRDGRATAEGPTRCAAYVYGHALISRPVLEYHLCMSSASHAHMSTIATVRTDGTLLKCKRNVDLLRQSQIVTSP